MPSFADIASISVQNIQKKHLTETESFACQIIMC